MGRHGDSCDTVSSGHSSQVAVDLVYSDKIVMRQAEAAASVEHFVGGCAERHRHTHLPAEIKREQHVFLLEIHVAVGGVGNVAFENERGAVVEHRRSNNALEKSVDGDFSRYATFFRERHAFAEADDFDDQSQIESNLELHGEALRADVGDFGADGEKDWKNAVECCFVP